MSQLVRRSACLLVTAYILHGCATHRLVVDEPNPATNYQRTTIVAYLWGIIETQKVATNCLDHALDEVRVRTNAANLFVTVATLGIVIPVQVDWKCRKLSTDPGEF